MLVTDAGYFPRAAGHGRRRPHGADEAVVILCVEGYGRCRVADRESVVPPAHALVLPPRVPHAYWADADRPWTIWWLHARGAHVTDYLTAMAATDREVIVELHDAFRAAATVEDAVTQLEQDETVPSLVAAGGHAASLLAQLASDQASGGRTGREPVQQAQEHLRRHLDRPVSVPDLARLAGMSVSHFSALFRRTTGGGVVEYLKRLRMARARELLLTTTMDVHEIAAAVGYADPFYFSRQFHRVHGCSPTTYRRSEHHP
jgi:AraC-like DNA-binding protein